jgi:predicted enzyme related to lactoylglutathione lyase
MFTSQGKFSWYELMTKDPAVSGKFYAEVVGWTTHALPSTGGMDYTTFNLGSVGIAGMVTNPMHGQWLGYIAVEDVDAHIEKIVEAGGKLWRPAVDVPGMLRFAVLSDPQGAPIVVYTPIAAMPTDTARPTPPTPGTIGWHELYTTDLDAGFEFYEKMFGWTKVTDMEMGPAGIYRIFDEGDQKPMGDGGMMLKLPEMPAASWTFYFNVDALGAAIARVEAGGGKLVSGPTQVPGGGWIMQGLDPLGTSFSLVSSHA